MIPVLLSLLFVFFSRPVYAIYDPLRVPNNKYGIHVADTNDIPDVPALVNSTGGDWGYVTVVIPETDRNSSKWQKIFDEMRRFHLIPLVRLATKPVGDHWTKPTKETIKDWISFLSSLNWPTANRYVILFNEPNHPQEWGGAVAPKEYAAIATKLAKDLKNASSDFFILPAGLDASAANDEVAFLQEVIKEQPDFLSLLDGWTSHSYPNPGFSGSPYAFSRGTLRTFYWELELLKSLGLQKNLPVFITETGWQHSQGRLFNNRLLTPEAVAANMSVAAHTVWSDANVVAVTPFVFSYQGDPFDHFSWKVFRGSDYYNHYYTYQNIQKIAGHPKQHESYAFSVSLVPDTLIAGSTYTLTSDVTNNGQGILDPNDHYELAVTFPHADYFVDLLPYIEPKQKGEITLHIKTPIQPGKYPMVLTLQHYDEKTVLDEKEVTLVPPPSLTLKAQLGWRKTSSSNDVSVLMYTKDNKLLQKFTGLTMKNGEVKVSGLTDIVPGREYRIVMLVSYYLPRQKIQILNKDETIITMKRSLPFDIDGDGALTGSDLVTLLRTQPQTILSRFVGP